MWREIQVSDDDILNGKPNSKTCCAIALAVDRVECMNRDGEFEPGRSDWQPEVHCSDELYIEHQGEGINALQVPEYYALDIHEDDRDDVDNFIKAYDKWAPHGGGDILSDLGNLRFRYRLEHYKKPGETWEWQNYPGGE